MYFIEFGEAFVFAEGERFDSRARDFVFRPLWVYRRKIMSSELYMDKIKVIFF